MTEVAIKVDVCNRRALDRGVPGLLRTLDRFGAPASWCVAFGPDNSGRAIRRILQPGFLRKMWRTRAPRMYGFRTLLYGTLLPAPPVGESASALLRSLEDAGHEVGLHGFDHVGWQDGVADMQAELIHRCYSRAVDLFEATLGHAPRFTAAPGWRVTPSSLQIQDEFGFSWASDCRGDRAFYPALQGRPSATLQIPTSLPTSDELLATGVAVEELASSCDRRLVAGRTNVVGLHAEAEGIHYAGWLEAWLESLQKHGVRFLRLSDVAVRERESAPVRRIVSQPIPGRAGVVACLEASV